MSAWMMNLVLFPLAFLFTMNVSTVSWTWDQGADNNSWNSAANWNTGTVPAFANTTDVTFDMDVANRHVNRTFGNRKIRKLVFGVGLDSTDKTFTLQYRNNANPATHYDLVFEADSGNALLKVANGIKVHSVTVGATDETKSTILSSTLDVVLNDSNVPLHLVGAVTGSGGLVKNGPGTLNLSGECSFQGDITVNDGVLVTSASCTNTFYIGLSGVNSKITGAGSAELNGAFSFDLANASATPGDSWTIVDCAASFGATFRVNGFVASGGGLWTTSANGADYQFYEGTRKLIVATPLLIKAKDRVMLSTATALPPFKATGIGLSEGDTLTGLMNVAYSCVATPSSPAGEYAIVPSGPEAIPGYAITYQNGILKKYNESDRPRVGFRLSEDSSVMDQYVNYPENYPICKTGVDLLYIRNAGRADNASQNPFVTRKALLEGGRYPTGAPDYNEQRLYSGDDVKWRITYYDNRAWDVTGIWLYRETWVYTGGPAGDTDATFPEDARIVSAEEMRRIFNSVGSSSLSCKDRVKFYQLLGGGTGTSGANSYTPFANLSSAAKTHLADYFDGVGLEMHIGDYRNKPEQANAVADIAKWTADQGQEGFVFVGGNPSTFMNLAEAQRTYHDLWQRMEEKGVSYRSPHLIYWRQGGHSRGRHTPESETDTVSHQQAWLIDALAPGGTSMFISPVPSPQRTFPGYVFNVAFCIGGEVSDPRALTVSASSSNQALIPDSGLQVSGTGSDRSLRVTPLQGQTGWSTITLTVTDGVRTKTTSFDVDVNTANNNSVSTQSSGRLNDSSTWGRAVPVGDLSEDNQFESGHPIGGGGRLFWLDLRTEDHGGRYIWRIQNGHTVSVDTNSFGLSTSCEPFFGETIELVNGVLTSASGEDLMVRNLILRNGGTVRAPDTGDRFVIRSNAGKVQFEGGTLQSGNAPGADLQFDHCYLTGTGTVNIAGSQAHGTRVQFGRGVNVQLWHTVGFTGKFVVDHYGQLDLPRVEVENASFGVELNGTGKLVLKNNTALKSLEINGTVIPPGTYTYNSFTPEQQAMLVSVVSNATLTIVP